MNIQRLNPVSDFAHISRSIIPDEWDTLNDLSPLNEKALRDIANNEACYFLLASINKKIIGTILAVLLLKTDGLKWLYIDKLDVHPNYQHRGIASALMQKIYTYGRTNGAKEAWLGADTTNDSINFFINHLDRLKH